MPRRVVVLHRWQIAVAFIALTVAFVVQGVLLKQTINDVNHSRRISCERTYEGIRDVFRPFFRPPLVRTAKERRDIRKFNRIINGLKARCDKQVAAKGTP